MNEELIEKCRLTDKEVQLLGQGYESAEHSCGGVSLNEYILKAQLAKAIPLISAEARKQERENVIRLFKEHIPSMTDLYGHDCDQATGIVNAVRQALKSGEMPKEKNGKAS